ncbi:pseudaminic acid cytidylyltransferase [Roseovarius sp. ZX-A-9]|uniref:pseudaminic acid cytidylyltransferase n=1 Tax=Roseovarius sp. ZX-A-9 TaxID=3014783 RepID=UPI00232D169C|nr:pseudaminic acid cytidylyltransferase [Roseovarius sp. ZX-A-9]
MRLAVIPARGGSKRIPRKNIRDFCGRPMIAWPISAALQSGAFDRVIVSTDDDQIAEVAIREGAEVPFRRPLDLSDDHTPTRPVIAHAIETLGVAGEAPSEVCCLYATAPFVTPEDLRAGLDRLSEPGVSYVFPVTGFAFPIQRALRRDAQGRVAMFAPEHFLTRSQDLEEAWHDAGQFYWADADQWGTDAPIYGPGAVGLEIPRWRVQDIDTQEDWHMAELLFRALEQKQ